MIANWVAIFPNLAIRALCRGAIQLQFTRDHSLSEVAFTNEIRHDADFADRFRVKRKKRVAQTRFLFPESALHLRKNSAAANLCRMLQCRRARIRVHRRAVSDNEKRSLVFLSHPAKTTSNAQQSTSNAQFQADVAVR